VAAGELFGDDFDDFGVDFDGFKIHRFYAPLDREGFKQGETIYEAQTGHGLFQRLVGFFGFGERLSELLLVDQLLFEEDFFDCLSSSGHFFTLRLQATGICAAYDEWLLNKIRIKKSNCSYQIKAGRKVE